MHTIYFFYKDKNGNEPVLDYMRELAKKKSKDSRIKLNKLNNYIELLSQHGTRAGEPYIKHLEDSAIGSNWKDVRTELFTKEEILESDMRVAIMSELIEARHEQGISQKKLEELSGVSQPVIARMETGKTSPQLDTVLKVLASLGKTLAVVPLEQEKN